MTTDEEVLLRRFANYLVLVLIATSVGYVLATFTLNPRAKYDALQPHPPEASISRWPAKYSRS